jgi:hypothetical protein
MVYSQFGTLYELISNVPRTSTDPSKPSSMAHVDGIIGAIKTQSSSQSAGSTNRSVSAPVTSSISLSSTFPPTQIFEVNAIQFASSQQSGGKKKMKNKPKKNNTNNENPKTPTQPLAPKKQPQ